VERRGPSLQNKKDSSGKKSVSAGEGKVNLISPDEKGGLLRNRGKKYFNAKRKKKKSEYFGGKGSAKNPCSGLTL